MAKYALLHDSLVGAADGVRLCEAPAATDGELALAHEPAYVQAVVQGHLLPQQQRAIGLPWSEALVERARRSVGATMAAAQAALLEGEGLAANLAGGTHHAHAGHGAGYCVFNDVVVAARLMQARWQALRRGMLRVLVVDLDVHQGDGTAAILAGDPSVFTLSLHGRHNYPARKACSDLDVALDDGCDDAGYLHALERALDQVAAEHRRQAFGMAFYLAGADTLAGDRLGRLALSTHGLARRDELVFDWLAQRRLPVAIAMAGGYGGELAVMVAAQRQTLVAAAARSHRWAVEQSGS